MNSHDQPNLYVRDGGRRYLPASPDQIVAAARALVDQRIQRGAALQAPEAAQALFRQVFCLCRKRRLSVAKRDKGPSSCYARLRRTSCEPRSRGEAIQSRQNSPAFIENRGLDCRAS